MFTTCLTFCTPWKKTHLISSSLLLTRSGSRVTGFRENKIENTVNSSTHLPEQPCSNSCCWVTTTKVQVTYTVIIRTHTTILVSHSLARHLQLWLWWMCNGWMERATCHTYLLARCEALLYKDIPLQLAPVWLHGWQWRDCYQCDQTGQWRITCTVGVIDWDLAVPVPVW
jgi:hypothetical protein